MFTRVPAGYAFVVERLARYHRTLTAGTHFLIPALDRVAFRFALEPRETALADTCITRDNVEVTIASVVRWQIVDARAAAYDVPSVADFVAGLICTHQRSEIAKRDFEDARETTRELQQAVLRAAADPAKAVGVKFVALELKRPERV